MMYRGNRMENVRSVVSVKFDDNKVGDVWEVVRVAEAKVARVGLAHGTVGQFSRGVGEYGVPPLEELGWIAVG
jgi:hypothetical protein